MIDSSEKLQPTFSEGLGERFKKEASEETRENAHGKEELPVGVDRSGS